MHPNSSSVNQSPDRDAVMAASRLINSRIRGSRSGLERREIARASHDPTLRHAAAIVAAFMAADGAERSEQSPEQAGGFPIGAGESASPASPASPVPASRDGLRQPQTGKLLTPGDHGSRQVVPGSTPGQAISPRRKMQPSYYGRRHGADGQFITHRFAAECQKIGDTIRGARESGKDGAE